MKSQISTLLEEAKIWLSSQGVPEPQSTARYAFGNVRAFIEAIEREPTELSIEKAVHALRYHIVDQYDWSAEYFKSISNFCDRADQIRRGMKRKAGQ